MKTYKEFLAEKEASNRMWYTFVLDEYAVHILFDSEEIQNITEAKYKGTPLGGSYAAQLHQAHSSVGQEHLHVYCKNNQLFSLNVDGTAHDKSHGVRIPNKVASAIAKQFPSFKIPKDNLIESAPIAAQLLFNMEQIKETL